MNHNVTVSPEPTSNYAEINRANWESRVAFHEAAYGLEAYRKDRSHLSDVVRADLDRLGDLTNLDVVHLQCHIGTDTLSLARLGAHVTGVDFSPSALAVARTLAAELELDISFVESELYAAPATLSPQTFDLVYTGVGALCWLPDVRRWAQVVADLLRPGGRLFIREGHPMLWALGDPRPDGLLTVEFPYFETPGTEFNEPFTYVAHEGVLSSPRTVQFNHGLGEIFTAVMDAGLNIESIEELDTIHWNPFGDAMEEVANGQFRLRDRPERVAMSYVLSASKPI